MASKNKSKGNSALCTTTVQRQADDASAHPTPSYEEIRHRAYEIYLDRGDLPGDELDDWLRAERELQKVALFARDWNRVQQRVAPPPKPEIDIRPMETKESGNQ
jgi:DUF2934 family protein